MIRQDAIYQHVQSLNMNDPSRKIINSLLNIISGLLKGNEVELNLGMPREAVTAHLESLSPDDQSHKIIHYLLGVMKVALEKSKSATPDPTALLNEEGHSDG